MANTNFDLPPEELREKISYCEDDGKLYWIKPKGFKLASSKDNKGYRIMTYEGRKYKQHRIVYWLHTGEWPEQIDHKNGIKDDNRYANLRPATNSENGLNRHKQQFNKHGYPRIGFNAETGKYDAYVRVNFSSRRVCGFDSKEEAAAAADILNYQVNGEFATFGLLSVDEIKAIIKGDRDEAQRIIQQAILVRSLKSYLLQETQEREASRD
ncbi:HNH endonuclease [Salmonella enterica subsp. enterica serovar 4,[5],12:b:-]|nr:HNH endonuclease [Salmonella enterica subsp. enterica serovar 4,[5],12:b:-]